MASSCLQGSGALCGIELVYQYETECHVLNENGEIRIDWDHSKEPGGVLGYDEFCVNFPKPSRTFTFATSVDLQAPPGYVLRTETHPRFFIDTTNTVPPALCGHVRTEWWSKKLFVVFKTPPLGHRYIFRKGDPYVQILFVPQAANYEPKPMDAADRQPPSARLEDRLSRPAASWEVAYGLDGQALPPRPVRLALHGWAGSPERKMENGSEPQPWHCPPFREAATYGAELTYPYETECHVINDDGRVRIEKHRSKGAADESIGIDFARNASGTPEFYRFETSLRLQAPPGHVLRTEPHPRFFTDASGTAPAALCGHVNNDETRSLGVLFRVPGPAERHIFRQGDPYVQLLFVPQGESYETVEMSRAEEERRVAMENGILLAKAHIAQKVWYNHDGEEFSDHYKVLAQAFQDGGLTAVESVIRRGVESHQRTAPPGRTIADYLHLAEQYQLSGNHVAAKQTLIYLRSLDFNNPAVVNRIGLLQWQLGLRKAGLAAMEAAVRFQPHAAEYHANLGEMLAQLGRYNEAAFSFRMSLHIAPNNPQIVNRLSQIAGELNRSCCSSGYAL